MTALESLADQLRAAQADAVSGDAKAILRLGNLVLASFHTIIHAIEELNRRRIA